ncbi:MAG: helix-turn-helix transcriptional regulator [Alphaproteobacteria bacterium]|nr:helix-turn-helix transcriptional regulator [Alphaproteobacteria bacterium]MBV9419856.1 helix-turn-helix transcriptional regulator [Alphaproteobacteria bacterium]
MKSDPILASGADSDVVLADVLQCLSEPLMVLRADRRVLFANAAAKELLDACDGMMMCGESLRGSEQTVHDALVKIVATIVAGAARESASMLLGRRSDGRCVVLHLSRLDQSPVRILARVCHNAALLAPDIQAARRAFGLSQTEAEIALRIATGDSPRIIASKRNVSEETVRWHIKNIYSKTCTSRLVDLVQQLCAARSPFFDARPPRNLRTEIKSSLPSSARSKDPSPQRALCAGASS